MYRSSVLLIPAFLIIVAGERGVPPPVGIEAAVTELAGFSVAGRVVDEESGLPVAGVVISIPALQRGTITDSLGEYRLNGISWQQHTVLARHMSYIPEQRQVWGCAPTVPFDDQCEPVLVREQRLNFLIRRSPALRYVPELTPVEGRVLPDPHRPN